MTYAPIAVDRITFFGSPDRPVEGGTVNVIPKKRKRERCTWCRKRVKMICQRGSGFCCQMCETNYAKI